jgi:sterol desaturase/sphingolipid hydroxylase (fatty acid hydroxylase superfamily)
MSPENEAFLRLSFFGGVFLVLAVAEAVWPRRQRSFGRMERWAANIGLSALNTILLRLSYLVVPALGVIAALYAEARGWGLMPLLGLRGWAAAILGFVILDLAVFGQHVAMHLVPPLWRLHRAHHADPDFDVTTGIRFHPLEILVSQAWKIVVVLAAGVPAAAVLTFEIALNATSMFSHSNLRLPPTVDAILRHVVVTPDMHRVHHSTALDELDTNFGFNLSVWDRLFSTYRAASVQDHTTMPIGLPSYHDEAATGFLWMLRFPFVRGPEA